MAQFPHCDSSVLHRPFECIYCDMHPDWQAKRVADGINFSGEDKPGLKPCPSDAARGLGQAGRVWAGNRAKPKANAICPNCGGPGYTLFNDIECQSMFCFPKKRDGESNDEYFARLDKIK